MVTLKYLRALSDRIQDDKHATPRKDREFTEMKWVLCGDSIPITVRISELDTRRKKKKNIFKSAFKSFRMGCPAPFYITSCKSFIHNKRPSAAYRTGPAQTFIIIIFIRTFLIDVIHWDETRQGKSSLLKELLMKLDTGGGSLVHETLMPSHVGSFCGWECVFTSLQRTHTHTHGQFFSSAHCSFKQWSINQWPMLNLESLMNASRKLLKLTQCIHEMHILYHVFDYVQLNHFS